MNEISDYKTLSTENTINVGGNNADESKAMQSDNTWSVARLKKSISMPEYWNCPSMSIYDIIDEPITILGAVPKNTIHGENRRLIHIQRQDGTEGKVFTNSVRVKEFMQMFCGWFGYIKHSNSINLCNCLVEDRYRNLVTKYF
jgi:hypothetical protein